MRVLSSPAKPAIDFDHPDLAGNQFGFEGGTVVKVGTTYHLFVAEMAGEPFWIKMRLAHWSSPDALNWRRESTLFETTGAIRAGDQRYALWSPMPVFSEVDNRWNLFYVAYEPGTIAIHMNGRIWRALSQAAGRNGIGGPYRDVGVILQPDSESQSWEGQQGTDSFYPYRVGDRWLAFYGSHNYEPLSPWQVGLAEASDLTGPWRRRAGNPVNLEPFFIENPIVTRVGNRHVCIYDSAPRQPDYARDARTVGVAFSADGVNWPVGEHLDIGPVDWTQDIRTPLCLIDEGDNVFTMLYTAELKSRKFWSVGMVRLACDKHEL